MGEKGNLLDTGQEIFANLAEQGPQFWLDYEKYKLTRAEGAQARVAVEQQAGAVSKQQVSGQDQPEERPANPAGG